MGEIEGIYTLPAMPEEYARLLDRLFSARRASSLYQPDHPIAVQAREAAYGDLTMVLRRQAKLVLTAVDDGLLVDRKLYRQTADSLAFSKRFRQRGIAKVTLKAGVDVTELTALLALLDIDSARIRAKGGPVETLREMGVTNITLTEEGLEEEEEQPQRQVQAAPELPKDRVEAILSELADYLIGRTEDLAEESYGHLLCALRDANTTARLISMAISRADRAQLSKGKSSLAAHLVQRIESTVLARSAGDWEEIKHKVREAVAQLPPSLRPKIFTLQAPTWREDAARAGGEEVISSEQLNGMLGELAKLIAELRGIPADIAGAASGAAPEYIPTVQPGDSTAKKSRLATLLDGMATMRIPSPPPSQEMPDLFQSLEPGAEPANVTWVLLELLEREQKLDLYSKIATELERLARELVEHDQVPPALALLGVLSTHAQESSGFPAWQRLRASGALQAIGGPAIMEFVCRVFRTGTPEQVKTAAEIVRSQGRQALVPLINLLAEPLSAAAENALMEVLVRFGSDAVTELARSLQSGYSQAGICIVKVLSEIGSDDALRALAKGLESRDVLVRLAVVQALGKKSSDFSATLLVPALRDANPSVRRAAANALGELRNPLAVPQLAKAATSFSWNYADAPERMEVLTALGKIGDDAAVAALAKVYTGRRLLGRRRYEELRQCAARALERVGSPEAISILAGRNGHRRPAPATVPAEREQ